MDGPLCGKRFFPFSIYIEPSFTLSLSLLILISLLSGVFNYSQSCFYSFICLFTSSILLVIYIFSLLPFLLTRTSSPFMLRPFLYLLSLSLSLFHSHLFTSLSCSYICIYLSPLFLASLIRTYARLSLLLNVTARG